MSTNGRRKWSSVLRSEEREDYGVTVMLRSLDGVTEICREFMGLVKSAMREATAYCDQHGLYITCVSTPNTIFKDLTRNSEHLTGANFGSKPLMPEQLLLTQIGRLDRLHPDLRRHPRR